MWSHVDSICFARGWSPKFATGLNVRMKIHCVAKLYAVLSVSTVKCLYSGGQNEGGRKAAPISISLFDFYDVKTL